MKIFHPPSLASKALIVALATISMSASATDAVDAIQRNLAAHNTPDALTLYREHRDEKPVQGWMNSQVKMGHPMFQMERANELFTQKKYDEMLPLWWRANVGMIMDSSVCVSPQAVAVALRVGSNYADMNKYLNGLGVDGIKKSLAIISHPWFEKNPEPEYDPSWLCYLMGGEVSAVKSKSIWTKQRGLAKMTVITGTKMVFQSLLKQSE